MSRSLVYGLQMLRLFDAQHPERSISDLADLMEVSRPTAHRYATTCLELGYLEQAPMRRYRLARRSTEIGLALLRSLPLGDCAKPTMRQLRDATGRTVSLATLDGEDVLYLHRLRGLERGQYALERGIGEGSKRAAHSTPAGRALLAARDGELRAVETHRDASGLDVCGLAIVLDTEEERLGALEVALPAKAMENLDELASLSRRLQAAASVVAARLRDQP